MIVLGPVADVFYFVADLPAATEWYRALLGTEPVDARPGQLVKFAIGQARLTLHVEDEYDANAPGRGTVAYWTVDDVDATVAAAVAHGAVAHRGPVTIFTGERLCQLLDPFGNLLGVLQAAG